MRDVFYTILIIWIVWRIFNSISNYRTKHSSSFNPSSSAKKATEGQTKVDYIPPVKKKISDDEGEYVDYEDIK